MKIRRLNTGGFSHEILIVLFAVTFAIAGVFYLISSHAAPAPTPSKQSSHGSIGPFKSAPAPTRPQRVQAHISSHSQMLNLVYSPNWSGYIASGPGFTEVSGIMRVPAVSCPVVGAQAFFWVGFDGYYNQTVEQDGIWAYCSPPARLHGTPIVSYGAWWEMWPTNLSQTMPLAIHKGDLIYLDVRFANNVYYMSIQNATTGKHFTQPARCAANLSCSRQSAEWIAERPSYGYSGSYYPLAKWQNLVMSQNMAAVNGSYQPFYNFPSQPIDMTDGKTRYLAQAGGYSSNAFPIVWDAPY